MYQTQIPMEVLQRLQRKESIHIVDVREQHEWNSGHIYGATHIPLGELPERVHELDQAKETILVCHSGVRSAMACEFLAESGYKVINMLGGMLHWPGDFEYGQR